MSTNSLFLLSCHGCVLPKNRTAQQQQCRPTLFCALSTASPNANTRLCWSRQYPSDWVRRLRLVICSITAMPCQMPTQLLLAVLDRMPLSSTPQSYEARLSQTDIGISYRCAADWTSQDEPRDREAKDHLARIMFGISPTSPAGNWLLRLVAFFVFGYKLPKPDLHSHWGQLLAGKMQPDR